MSYSTISCRLDSFYLAWAREIANRKGITLNKFIDEAVEEKLDRYFGINFTGARDLAKCNKRKVTDLADKPSRMKNCGRRCIYNRHTCSWRLGNRCQAAPKRKLSEKLVKGILNMQ